MQLKEFKLERFLSRYEFNTESLLCCSDCETMPLGRLLELEPGARKGLEELSLGYTPVEGSEYLRQNIAALYRNIGPEHVLVHAGAEEAIFIFLNVMLGPGDHAIVQWPCYQSLFEIPRSLGCAVSRWEMKEEENWRVDLDRLEDLIRPETKVVLINSPHNPTGALIGADDRRRLAEMAEKRGFLIFSDEVYRLLEHDPADRGPSLCELTDKAVSLGVMSKSFGLAGLRLGWVAARDPEILRRMLYFKDYTTICTAAPSEYLSALALRHADRIAGRSLAIIRENLDLLDEFFTRWADRFDWRRPTAGPIAFPSLKNGEPADEFCRKLVETAGVLLLPGVVYGEEFTSNFRIGFGRSDMPRGLKKLDDFLKSR